MNKTTAQFFKGSTIAVLGFGLALTAFAGTWTAPTGTPPNNNVDAPVNVSATPQYKPGPLSIDSARVGGTGLPVSWTKLDVLGVISTVGLANFGASDLVGKVTVGCVPTSPGGCPISMGGGMPTLFEVGNGYSNFYANVSLKGANLFMDNGRLGMGLGSISPNRQIHVHSSNNQAGITISTGSTNWMNLYQPYNSGELRIAQGTTGSGSSDIATFKATGQVGIGTVNPNGLLTLSRGGAGDVADIIFKEQDNAAYGAAIRYNNGTDALTISTINNNTDMGGLVIARTSGNVGVGTGMPTEKLDVQGKAKVQALQVGTSANGGKVLGGSGSGNADWKQIWNPGTPVYHSQCGGLQFLTLDNNPTCPLGLARSNTGFAGFLVQDPNNW